MVNRAVLTRAASKMTGLSLRDTSICIDSIIETIGTALSRGEHIELRGFGSFDVKKVAARKAVFANIPPHGRIVFKPCQKLRMSVWNNTKGT